MEELESIPYVVATGEIAQAYNQRHPHDIWSINQLIEDGAARCPDTIVAGMPSPAQNRSGSWSCTNLTFKQLLQASSYVSSQLHEKQQKLPRRTEDSKEAQLVVGLLAASSLDFLVHWLAVLRLGCASLLIAPQCSPDAVAFLLSETGAQHLLHDQKYAELAASGTQACKNAVQLVQLQSDWRDVLRDDQAAAAAEEAASRQASSRVLTPQEESDTLAVIFHSSGSTGMPKPIYQKHAVWTRALPRHPGPPSFTTTPLYHGGMSDLLRSLMSDSCTFLFTDQAPITAANVLSSLQACGPACPAYFLAVPYVLKLLAEHDQARAELAKFDMISVGGAPLPEEIGDEMVQKYGWKLVSRLGSSECGFLMSSWRDFDRDTQWSWLRVLERSKLLNFEPFEGQQDLCELIVAPSWPTLNKTNRSDGSYASGDLYQKHPTTPSAWRYAGRADDVLVLSNGEKASPGNIESTLRSSPLVVEVVLFGSNRPAVCAFVYVDSSKSANGDLNEGVIRTKLLEELRPTLELANASAPSYAQLQEELIHFSTDLASLPRTSKGTIRRSVAEQQFESQIAALFERPAAPSTSDSLATLEATKALSTDQLDILVQKAVSKVASKAPGLDQDLFDFGITSLQAMRVRSNIASSTGFANLSTNVVFEHPSCQLLARHIQELLGVGRQAQATQSVAAQMQDLVEQYGQFNARKLSEEAVEASDSSLVILTGATGSLGAFLLAFLLSRYPSLQVVCLCRAESDEEARRRVESSLRQREQRISLDRVHCFQANLASQQLGLSKEALDLCCRAKTIIHSAWPVNFRLGLSSFQSQLAGLHNLLQLGLSSSHAGPHFIFCSSIASVMNPSRESAAAAAATVTEALSTDPSESGSVGYSQSKWVAEGICAKASSAGLAVDIARLGQLCGDTQHGVWNPSEAWPLLIKASADVGAAPKLNEAPSWLPIDLAAYAILDLMDAAPEPTEARVAHVYNSDKTTSWSTIVEYLVASGLNLQGVSIGEWLQRLESLQEDHPAGPLRSFWETAYGGRQGNSESSSEPLVDTRRACRLSPALASAGPISQTWVNRFVKAWKQSGFLT